MASCTVDGAGATLSPETVMAIVRPELVADVEELELLGEDDELELLVEVVVATTGLSPRPPHAVTATARASPAAYQMGRRHVRSVTNRSLGNEF
jgi:hypothetical protein